MGLAVTSGVLYFVAFPGVGVWPLGFVALVPLVVALRTETPARALALGWLSGFTMNALGLYWLVPTLQEHAGLSAGASLAGELVLSAVQGGRLACLGWLVARGSARGWPFEVVFLLAFAASEVAWPGVFPWSFGAVLHEVVPLLQMAELLGPTGVALVLVAANLAVAEAIDARLHRRPVRRLPLLALGAAVPLAAGFGVLRVRAVEQHSAASETGVVALIQANVRVNSDANAWEHQLALAGALDAARRPDLIVWSEALPGQVLTPADVDLTLQRIQQRNRGIPTLLGAQVLDADGSGEVLLHNSALLASAGKGGARRYDKQRLLPFAERFPLASALPWLPPSLANVGGFAPGSGERPLHLGERKLAVFICYEDAFSGLVRDLVRAGGADVLVNLTNDAWFGATTEPEIHLALAKFRAVEHRRFLVRATNSGVSAVVDATGRVVSRAPAFTSTTHVERIRWLSGKTPFLLWGETPLQGALVLTLLFAFVRAPAPRVRRNSPTPSSDS